MLVIMIIKIAKPAELQISWKNYAHLVVFVKWKQQDGFTDNKWLVYILNNVLHCLIHYWNTVVNGNGLIFVYKR
jgi:hypothetical protein